MSRNMTPAVAEETAKSVVRPCIFFEGQFVSGYLRLWTGKGEITWNSETWTGAGNLIGMSQLTETTDIGPTRLSASLSGVPIDLVSLAISDARQGMTGRVWVGVLDETGAVIADPVQAFSGRLDVPTIQDGAETCTVTITYVSRWIDITTTREFRYTHEGQKLFFPNDRGFEFVTALQDKEVRWGD